MCRKRRSIKVLPLPKWCKYGMQEPEEDAFKKYVAIPSVYMKEGWFYDRRADICWFEIYHDGRFFAFKDHDAKMFKHHLKVTSHIPLLNEEIKAMKTLMLYSNRNKKEYRDLLYIDWHYKELIEISRSAKRFWRSPIGKEILETPDVPETP